MGTNIKREMQKVTFTSLSKKQMAQIGGGECDMTPKERCEFNHVGVCGTCDKDGTFTACA